MVTANEGSNTECLLLPSIMPCALGGLSHFILITLSDAYDYYIPILERGEKNLQKA